MQPAVSPPPCWFQVAFHTVVLRLDELVCIFNNWIWKISQKSIITSAVSDHQLRPVKAGPRCYGYLYFNKPLTFKPVDHDYVRMNIKFKIKVTEMSGSQKTKTQVSFMKEWRNYWLYALHWNQHKDFFILFAHFNLYNKYHSCFRLVFLRLKC